MIFVGYDLKTQLYIYDIGFREVKNINLLSSLPLTENQSTLTLFFNFKEILSFFFIITKQKR